MKKAPDDFFERYDEDGWPVLPKRGDKNLADLKDFIRAYVTVVYSE